MSLAYYNTTRYLTVNRRILLIQLTHEWMKPDHLLMRVESDAEKLSRLEQSSISVILSGVVHRVLPCPTFIAKRAYMPNVADKLVSSLYKSL